MSPQRIEFIKNRIIQVMKAEEASSLSDSELFRILFGKGALYYVARNWRQEDYKGMLNQVINP
jgi:hypothetical protein